MTRAEKQEIGNRIAQRRIEKNYSQEKFADALNLTRAAIGKIERGEVLPKLETLLAIADFLEVSADWIIRGDESTVISNIPQNLLGLLTKLNQLSEGEQAIAIDTLNTLCDGLIRKRSTA